jgi:hypothetical protein
MFRTIVALVLLLACTGCGPDLTRSLWNQRLPRRHPEREAAATARVIITPVTATIDLTGELLVQTVSNPQCWEGLARLLVAVMSNAPCCFR